MPRIPGINHLDAVRALEKGRLLDYSAKGKHITMTNGRVKHRHSEHNPINAFTMGGIIRRAGLTADGFRKLL